MKRTLAIILVPISLSFLLMLAFAPLKGEEKAKEAATKSEVFSERKVDIDKRQIYERIEKSRFPLPRDLKITISLFCYIFWCLMPATIIRFIIMLLKANAIKAGEHIDKGTGIQETKHHGEGMGKQSPEDDIRNKSFWMRVLIGFSGFCGPEKIKDYWIPFFIGFSELASYPILMFHDQVSIIGGWLAIKTAGQWQVWKHSRNAFNRFLFGNLLALGFSYLCLLRFITK